MKVTNQMVARILQDMTDYVPPSRADEEEYMALMDRIIDAWSGQKSYNKLVRSIYAEDQDWASIYLLGLVGEVDEVLKEINWKRHRRNRPLNRENLAGELADLTKYVFSLWQHYDFKLEDMVEQVLQKNEQLLQELRHDFFPPNGRNVLITDLDGTGADFRREFNRWLRVSENDEATTLAMDVQFGIKFDQYEKLKEQFEASGGYFALEAYPDWVELIRREQARSTFLIVMTARPVQQFSRIRSDTKHWLRALGINPDVLLFGRDERVLELLRLGEGNRVALLEDDPGLVQRAATSGIPVLMRVQPYNERLIGSHKKIDGYRTYPPEIDWDLLYPEEV